MKNAVDTTKEQLGIWTFSENGIYNYKSFVSKPGQKNRHYLFDEKTCEIILNPSKKNSRDSGNLEIIYLDNKYLMYKADNNPKGYYTYILRRK